MVVLTKLRQCRETMSRVIDFYNGHDKVSHSHGTPEHVVMVLFVAWQAIQEKGSRWARGASLGALVEELRRWRDTVLYRRSR